MRLTLIGPGDIEYHYQELLGLSKQRFKSELETLAETLADSGVELEFLPDKGVSLEIVKIYKKKGGKKVVGVYPKSDKEIGIKHLQKTLDENNSLFDELIDSQNWWKHDILKGLFGRAVLYLGSSFGTDLERCGSSYVLNLLKGNKKGVETAGKYLHPELQANNDFTVLVYSPFVIGGKLPREHEKYYEKFGINLIYIKNPEHLKDELKEIIKRNK